jgi:hypothetical protein
MGRECGTYGGRGGSYRVLVGKRDGMRPLGIIRCRWKDDTEINFKEILYCEIILVKFNGVKHSTLHVEGFFSAVGICYSLPATVS